jgi:signal transduction histidine kinase
MKLLLTLLVLWGTTVSYSQTKLEDTPPHPSIKKIKVDNRKTSTANAASLKELFELVEKTSTNLQKVDYYFWISRYYASVLKIDSALYYVRPMREWSEQSRSETGMAKYYLAKSYALSFRNQRGKDSLDIALAIFSRNQDHLFMGLVYREWASQASMVSKFDQAVVNYHAAIANLSLTDEQRTLQRMYFELGKAFLQTYKVDSSAFYLVTSLKLAEKMNDANKIFNSSGMLGELYLASDNLDNAAKYFKYALDSRTPQTGKVSVRGYMASYAGCLIAKGDFDKAGEVIKEYEVIADKLGDAWGFIILEKIKGAYEFHRQNYPAALQHLSKAFSRKEEIKFFNHDVKNITFYLARTEYEMGDYANAIKHFFYVMQLANELQYGLELMESNLLVAQAYQKLQKPDSAFLYLKMYDHIKDSLSITQREKTFIELTTKYEAEKKEQQIKLLQKEKDLYSVQLTLKNEQIEKQNLLNSQRAQEMALLSQQNQISRLEASKNTLALENQQKEIDKNQNKLVLLSKENQLQAAITGKESQRKNFAYIAIATILLFSSYVYYRSVRNKNLSRQLAASLVELKDAQEQLIKAEKEKEAENIRVRISRDIHDEVGATLSGVALFSEIAKQKMEKHPDHDVQQYLEHISTNSKEMVEKMSDIVWAINPQNDSFDRIIAKLESYAVNVCAGKGIKLHLEIDESLRSYYPGMQVRKNIYMLIKEAINNAVKYSNSKNIYFSLRNPNGNMLVEVRDDGQGFDTGMIRKGNGLNNMEARAAELKAAFRLQSGEGKGTSVSLQFNFHPAGGHLEVV